MYYPRKDKTPPVYKLTTALQTTLDLGEEPTIKEFTEFSDFMTDVSLFLNGGHKHEEDEDGKYNYIRCLNKEAVWVVLFEELSDEHPSFLITRSIDQIFDPVKRLKKRSRGYEMAIYELNTYMDAFEFCQMMTETSSLSGV